jgi:hypothetical protein
VTISIEAGAFCGSQIDLLSSQIDIECSQSSETKTVPFKQDMVSKLSGNQPESVWELELEQILELYELEPDSKWVMLTLVHLYQHLKKPFQLSVDILEKLIKTDGFRKGYYEDYRILNLPGSSIIINEKMGQLKQENHIVTETQVDFSNLGLSIFPVAHQLLFCQKLNVSNNLLATTKVLKHLVMLKEMNLDGNQLQDLKGLERLVNLKVLSVQKNRLATIQAFYPLKKLSIQNLAIAENLISASESDEILSWF